MTLAPRTRGGGMGLYHEARILARSKASLEFGHFDTQTYKYITIEDTYHFITKRKCNLVVTKENYICISREYFHNQTNHHIPKVNK